METDTQVISYLHYARCVNKAKKAHQFIETHRIDEIIGKVAYLPVNILIFFAAYYRMRSYNQDYSTAKAAVVNECYPE